MSPSKLAALTITATLTAVILSTTAAEASPDDAKLKSMADQRAEGLAKDSAAYAEASSLEATRERAKALAVAAKATRKQAKRLAQAKAEAAKVPTHRTSSPVQSDGKNCLPLTKYRIAARFGQTGIWARYHTGFDFSAGVGTPIHAPAAGRVTNAGRGHASAWAGNYVAIRYPDGTSTLMAHMSTVSVSVGQTVSACQVVGAVGMTGRTFGPHLHFEVYPVGVTPGDLYSAVNPLGWLKAHGLHP